MGKELTKERAVRLAINMAHVVSIQAGMLDNEELAEVESLHFNCDTQAFVCKFSITKKEDANG